MKANFFYQHPRLATKRLDLKELVEEDVEAFLPIAHSGGKKIDGREEALTVINRSLRQFQEKNSINWAIWYSDILVGTVGFYRGFEGDVGEIGYVMNPDYRGQGIMSEAIQAVVKFGLNDLELKRIIAYTDLNNEPSVRLLNRAGFNQTDDKVEQFTKFEINGSN